MLCAAALLSGGLLIWRLTAHNQGSISPEFASAPTKNSKVGLRQKKRNQAVGRNARSFTRQFDGDDKGHGSRQDPAGRRLARLCLRRDGPAKGSDISSSNPTSSSPYTEGIFELLRHFCTIAVWPCLALIWHQPLCRLSHVLSFCR